MPSLCTPDTEDAAVKSQLETVAEEYNHLLVSQLESQRRYYEVGVVQRSGSPNPQHSTFLSNLPGLLLCLSEL